MYDVVYVVREGDNNEELRYSLRSLSNLPVRQVWIVGYKPTWVTGVGYIRGNPHIGVRPSNGYANILLACRSEEIPDEFLLFNDDFFITEPMGSVPTAYRGTLGDHLKGLGKSRSSWWGISLDRTMAELRKAGHEDPLSYELHIPFPTVKERMRETLERYRRVQPQNPPQWRSLYGNEHRIGGVRYPDPKAHQGELRKPFHSTEDGTWMNFGLADMFTEPSPYELG